VRRKNHVGCTWTKQSINYWMSLWRLHLSHSLSQSNIFFSTFTLDRPFPLCYGITKIENLFSLWYHRCCICPSLFLSL
jgi:hypothetical protein